MISYKDKARVQELYAECLKEIADCGIVHQNISSMTINEKLVGVWGKCKRKQGKFFIEISGVLLLGEDKAIKETLIHEILHTCKDCQNHGNVWKSYTQKMNETYGYKIKRCNTADDKSLSEAVLKESGIYKYAIICNECNQKVFYKSKSKAVIHPENYQCAKCGGSLRVSILK